MSDFRLLLVSLCFLCASCIEVEPFTETDKGELCHCADLCAKKNMEKSCFSDCKIDITVTPDTQCVVCVNQRIKCNKPDCNKALLECVEKEPLYSGDLPE